MGIFFGDTQSGKRNKSFFSKVDLEKIKKERMKKKMFGLTFHENILNPFPSPSALFPAISTFLSLFSFASAQYYKTIYIRNSRL